MGNTNNADTEARIIALTCLATSYKATIRQQQDQIDQLQMELDQTREKLSRSNSRIEKLCGVIENADAGNPVSPQEAEFILLALMGMAPEPMHKIMMSFTSGLRGDLSDDDDES